MSNKIIIVWLILLTAWVGFDSHTESGNRQLRRQKFEEIYANMNTIEKYLNNKSQVDFTVSTIQELTKGFLLTQATQNKHLTGIKFTGRVINTLSVKRKNVIFKLTVANVSKEFTINQISSGNSTGFSVYIPDIKLEDARFAEIQYINALVSYLAT